MRGFFPDKPGLAGCRVDSQSPTILIPGILTGQAKTSCTHRVLQAVTHQHTLTTVSRGFEAVLLGAAVLGLLSVLI